MAGFASRVRPVSGNVRPHATMEVIRADPRLRRFAVRSLIALVLAGALGLWAFQGWLAGVTQLPAAIAQQHLLIAFASLVGISCAALLALAAFLWTIGARVRRSAQFPAPGMRVLRDTAVLRDGAAERRGRTIQGTGAVLVVCCLALLVAAWRFYVLFSGYAA